MEVKRNDILYPELSYKIVGLAFNVYNTLGPGYHEKYYQQAFAEELANHKITFRREVPSQVLYRGKSLGRNFIDFLIDDKIIVEVKKGDHFSKTHLDQVLNYLKITNKKLALIINFGSREVKFKRILNTY